MSRQITQPVNQVRLTNVAVVRMNKGGKRFEVCCYKNKIVNYRQKIETDLGEVLQADRVFTNVSKGTVASTKDLKKVFGTTDQEEVIKLILEKGQVQISDLERKAALSNVAREVANMVATKCVHPETNRPYTANQIRDAMKVAEFASQPTSARSVKQQFLDCVKVIQEKNVLNIQRAKMEVAIVTPSIDENSSITSRLMEEAKAVVQNNDESQTVEDTNISNNSLRIRFLIDPSQYRTIESIAKDYNGTVEIIRHTVMREGDAEMSLELERQHVSQMNKNEQQHPTKGNGPFDNDSPGSPVSSLVEDFQSMSTNYQESDSTPMPLQERYMEEDDDDDDQYAIVNTRKANKKAQKKSKKAKRREKEDAQIRQQRIEAEKARREEREQRLGKTADEAPTGNLSNKEGGDQPGQSTVDMKKCNTCGAELPASEYRAHFRSDWHRYNVKLKMKGIAPVCKQEFDLIDSETFFATDETY